MNRNLKCINLLEIKHLLKIFTFFVYSERLEAVYLYYRVVRLFFSETKDTGYEFEVFFSESLHMSLDRFRLFS